jgi:hypothetical protein
MFIGPSEIACYAQQPRPGPVDSVRLFRTQFLHYLQYELSLMIHQPVEVIKALTDHIFATPRHTSYARAGKAVRQSAFSLRRRRS